MCLLAEDEGNEEEILRLMESVSPQKGSSNMSTVHPICSSFSGSAPPNQSSSVPPDIFDIPIESLNKSRKPATSQGNFISLNDLAACL